MNKHAEIAECAYHIWERMGRPDDKALECWLEAEAEVETAETVRKHVRRAATARDLHHG